MKVEIWCLYDAKEDHFLIADFKTEEEVEKHLELLKTNRSDLDWSRYEPILMTGEV